MSMLALSFAYLRRRRLTTAMNIILLALGVATIAFLLLLERGLDHRLSRDVAGIDMVVGAKGSPMQLVLSAVLQVDVPTGNIPLSAVEELGRNPLVRQVIPIAMGDSFKGARIIGTDTSYIDHYGGRLAAGRLFAQPMEAVLGAAIARDAGISVGDRIIGSHGLTGGGDLHAGMPYMVVGILAPTGTILDRLVLTPVASVWAVHEHHHHDHDHGSAGEAEHDHDHDPAHRDHDHEHDDDHAHHDHDQAVTAPDTDEPQREVTALLIRYATPLAAARLPRQINQETDLQAASPAAEMLRLRTLMGVGLDAMRLLGGVLVLAAALSTFVALANSLQERRYDLAVMRALGAGRFRITGQILAEALIVTIAGGTLGLLLAHGSVFALSLFSDRGRDLGLDAWAVAPGEFWLLALSVPVALAASLIPAIQAYRTDVSRLLAQG